MKLGKSVSDSLSNYLWDFLMDMNDETKGKLVSLGLIEDIKSSINQSNMDLIFDISFIEINR